MKVMITRKNGSLSDSLKVYIEKSVSELGRHFPNIIDAHVILDLEGREHTVEITMRVNRRTLFSSLQSNNLRAAFDGCVDKLDKQLGKVKGKYKRKGHKTDIPGAAPVEEAIGMEVEEEDLPLLTIDRDELVLEAEGRTGTSN